jgi:hypothetical protein
MGSQPKKDDYQATAQEKALASVGQAQYQKKVALYDPLLRDMRDKSLSTDVSTSLRSRASADTAQALTKNMNYGLATKTAVSAPGDYASALSGQLGVADSSAKNIKNQMQTSVLGTANGQAADALTGMGKASRIATSNQLNTAKNNQTIAQAKLDAAVGIATTAVGAGLGNMSTTGVKEGAKNGMTGVSDQKVKGTFFTSVNKDGSKNDTFGKKWNDIFGGT